MVQINLFYFINNYANKLYIIVINLFKTTEQVASKETCLYIYFMYIFRFIFIYYIIFNVMCMIMKYK